MAVALTFGLLTGMNSARALEIPSDLQLDLRSIVVSKDELLCLAENDYWEARSEDIAGRIAVARVVLNRAMDPRFPNNICDVVKQKKGPGEHCQFSWVCEHKTDEAMDPKAWRDSLKIAAAVLQKDCAIPDPTGGALWYHASFTRPNWAAGFESTTIIGTHVFYREPDDLSKPLPTRKPFIYRLNAFAEFASHRHMVTTVAMADSPVAIKSDAIPAEPLTR
jgi:spore germination cell wall hydrolase CwlJ-like protein